MKLTDCKRRKRYLFFYSEVAKKKTKYFVGNFNWLFSGELIVSDWEKNGINQEGILSLPRAWIKDVQTLNDIVDDTILSEDIVLKIGEY